MRALGRAIDRLVGAYITAEDVGTTVADMDILRTQTKYARGTSTGVGAPSPYTARGVAHAIRCAVREKHQTTNLSGIRVAIQGLGNVGRHLAEMLNAEGAELVVTDIDPARLEAAADDFGADVVDSDAHIQRQRRCLCALRHGGCDQRHDPTATPGPRSSAAPPTINWQCRATAPRSPTRASCTCRISSPTRAASSISGWKAMQTKMRSCSASMLLRRRSQKF